MAKRFEIAAPAAGFTGESAGVAFAKGKATVEVTTPELRRAVAYFRQNGYVVVDLDELEAASEADPAEEETADPPPTRSATKAEWKAYALVRGVDEAEAEKTTRDDLAERFLGPKES